MESHRCEAAIGVGGQCSFRATNPTLRLCGTHVRQQRDNPDAFRWAPEPSPSSSSTPSAAAPEPPSVPPSPATPGEVLAAAAVSQPATYRPQRPAAIHNLQPWMMPRPPPPAPATNRHHHHRRRTPSPSSPTPQNPSTAAAAVARQLARMAAAPDAPPPPPLAAHPAFRHDSGEGVTTPPSASHTPAPFAAQTRHRKPAWMRPRPLPAVLPQRTPPRPAAYRPTGASTPTRRSRLPVAANAANAPPRYIGHWRPINRHPEEDTPSPTPCPVVPQRCGKVHRNSGRRCRNMTEIANGYCFAHQPSDAIDGEESPEGGACAVMGCGGESFEPENEYCDEHQWILRRLIGLNGS